MMYKLNKVLVISSNASDIGYLSGRKATVIEILPPANANDYLVNVEDYGELKVHSYELAEIKPEYLAMELNVGDKTTYIPTNEKVFVTQIDYLHGMVEIEHDDGSRQVVSLDSLRKLDKESDSVEEKIGFEYNLNDIGELIDIFLGHYKNSDGTYTVPKQLLVNMFNTNLEE